MLHSCITAFVLLFITSAVAIPPRLNTKCRMNICDDRPECPRTSCPCLFASRVDCDVYYQCINGKPYQYKCSPGLLFNPEKLTCDYSYNVNCPFGSTLSPSTEVINTTSTFVVSATPSPKIIITDITEEAITKVKTTPDSSTTSPSTTDITDEKTKEITIKPITTETTKEPTTLEKTREPTTPETTKEPTTPETTKEPTTPEKTREPTTAEITKEPTSTTMKFTPGVSTTILVTTLSSAKTTENEILVTNSTFTSPESVTVSTVVVPSSEFLCPSRFGLFADPKSCFRFYHCSHWTPYHKWCPSGLHFNPRLRVCDWPYRAGCAFEPIVTPATVPPPNDTQGTCDCDCCQLPVPGECTAYILCINKIAFKMYCGSDLYFNPMTGTCDLEENVDCTEEIAQCPEPNGRFLLEGSCSYFVECQNGKRTIKNCPEGLQFNQSSEMCSWLGSCSGQNPDRIPSGKVADVSICKECDYCFKPYGTSCTSYIRCFQDTATEERCASGLFFNPVNEICDHDYNVDCPGTQPEPQCPEMFGYFSYPGECGRYLQCINGSAIVKTCPGVLHFDPVRKHCDWPWAAGCSNNSDSNPTDQPSTNITECDCDCCLKPDGTDCKSFVLCINKVGFMKSCSSGLRFNPQTENCDFSENVDCPITPEIPGYICHEFQGLFPHPEDCEKFIHCAHGFPYVKECPSNLHFNPKLKVCDWPYAAGCEDFPPTDDSEDDHDLPCDICDSCFIPDETDCSSYIYCRNGTGSKLRCTGSLLFNPEIEACDHASNVKCSNVPSSECSKPDGLFPAIECSQFIHCSNGIPYLKDCPDGLHFNTKVLVCDWPENANCGSGEIPTVTTPSPLDDDNDATNQTCDCDCCFLPHENDCSKYILCLDGYAYEGQCSRGLLFNPSIQNCDFAGRVTCDESSPLCPQPNGLFPIKEQCSSYIKCSDGISKVEHCFNGTHFSTERKQCLDPCKANCDSSYDCRSTSPSSPSTPIITPSTTTISPLCPEKDGLFPNEDDCSTFYQCSEGRPHIIKCPSGLHFSSEHSACEYPCEAKCNTSIDCKPPTSTPSPYCPKSNGSFPNNDDCSSFYKCSAGTAYLVNCPSGLHFSYKHQACEYPCIAKCNASIDCTPTTTTPSPYCPENNGLFPNHDDCTSFYKCSSGQPYLVNCPSDLHFSYKHQACEYPCEAKCNTSIDCVLSTTTPSPYCPENNGLFSNEDDCSSFYKCSEGRAYLMNCPSGLHFSHEHQACEYPCEAKCNASIDCNSPTTSSTTTPYTYPSSTLPPYCPEKEGLFLNEDNCASFYMCSGGRAYLINCPPGLHFSSDHQVCDYPCEARCNKSIDCSSTVPIPTSTPVVITTTTISPNCLERDGIFPNKDDCTSFYTCSGGRAYLTNCPSGLHFSYDHLACEYPCAAKCDASLICFSTTPEPIPSSPSPHCPVNDGLYPITGNCSAFYLCSNGQVHLIPCPPGLHFSEIHETCEMPCIANCNKSLDCGTTPNPVSSTPHPQSPECEEPDGLFPNPEDCGSFYQCSSGRSHLMYCPKGLHFSMDDAACERPCVAGCDISKDCPPEIPDNKGNCTCDNCYLPDPNDCSAFYFCDQGLLSKSYCPFGSLFSKKSGICEDENSVDCEANGDPSMCPDLYGFFPYPGDCKKFVHCDNGVAHVRECQGDLEYDPLSRVCTKPKGNCGDTVLDPNCPEPTGLFPDPRNCSVFYHCEHGVAYPKHCTSPLMFNPETEVCDWPENVACGKDAGEKSTPSSTSSVTPQFNISTPGVTSSVSPSPSTMECYEVPGVICPCACRVPTYDECSSYLQCQEDGTACKKFCPEGLYFNKREMVCDLPENVECRDFFFTSIRRAKLMSHH